MPVLGVEVVEVVVGRAVLVAVSEEVGDALAVVAVEVMLLVIALEDAELDDSDLVVVTT
jgi:hypothetical protein